MIFPTTIIIVICSVAYLLRELLIHIIIQTPRAAAVVLHNAVGTATEHYIIDGILYQIYILNIQFFCFQL